MKYRAKQDGFVDMHYVCEGEIFDYDGKTPSWAVPVEEPAKPDTFEEAALPPPPTPKKKSTKK